MDVNGDFAPPEDAVHRILSKRLDHSGIWQADVFPSPTPLREGDRIARPPTTLVVDADSGFIFQCGVQSGSPVDVLGGAILEAISSSDWLPSILKLRPALAPKFHGLSTVLGIRVEPEDRMNALDRARRSMSSAMGAQSKRAERARYPAATVSIYGPDDRSATKIVVGIVKTPEQDSPEPLTAWKGHDVLRDAKAASEIEALLAAHRVKVVIAPRMIMGCPHEEGKDFELGGNCPSCPWWKDKQGSRGPERDWGTEVLDRHAFLARLRQPH